MKHCNLHFLLASLLLTLLSQAQELPAAEGKHKFKPVHSVDVAIGHAHSFDGRDADGNRIGLNLPMWGIGYDFQFKPKWALGLHTDFIVENFTVEKNLEEGDDKEVVERSYPIAPALMGIFKPSHHWSFGLGVGAEFEKSENYLLNRLAVEYAAEIKNGWEVVGALQYDFRWSAYDTWTFGLGIAKKLGKNQE